MVPPYDSQRRPPDSTRPGRVEKAIATLFLVAFLLLAAVRITTYVLSDKQRVGLEVWATVGTTILGACLALFCHTLVVRSLEYRRRTQAEVEQLNQRLQRKVAELEATFDVIPVGLVVAEDPLCRSMRGNAVLAKMLGVPAGGNLSKSAPADEQPPYRCFQYGRELSADELPMQVAAASGATVEGFEMELVRDGRTVKLCGSTAPLFDEAGRPRGAIGAFWDIAQFKELEERLIDERDAAEAAVEARDRFLAEVSHDLRTPLHAVVVLADRVRRHGLGDAERDAALDGIASLCKQQQQLIGDVLDITRIAHGALWLDRRPVSVAAVLGSACETVRAAAEAKGVRLEVQPPADPAGAPAQVEGDAVRLEQVFWNLLSNAIKYTPAGGRVRVTHERDGTFVRVSVTDTGVGIDAESLPLVFDRFRQKLGLDPAGRDGLGLGLSIVKHVVELHGGSVSVESEGVGRGAAFTVQLPLLVAACPAAADAGASPETSARPVDSGEAESQPAGDAR